MQLRSGRSTMRRESRNYDEFNERRRYQEEQRRIEESIYDDVTNEEEEKSTKLKRKMDTIFRKTKHLLYLNQCQKDNNSSFTEKVNNIKEIYELFLANINDFVEFFNNEMKHDKRMPKMIYERGNLLRVDINKTKRTRRDAQLAGECNDLINNVVQIIYYSIL